MSRLGRVVSDFLGGFERLRCPHCSLEIRFRAVSPAEGQRFRKEMADHIDGHATS